MRSKCRRQSFLAPAPISARLTQGILIVSVILVQQAVSLQIHHSILTNSGTARLDHDVRNAVSQTASVDNTDQSTIDSSNRRHAIQSLVSIAGITAISPILCEAAEERIRPYAPLEALVPAARNRLLLSKCLLLSKEMARRQQDGGDVTSVETQLKKILPPPSSTKTNPKQLTGTSMRAGMNIYTANLRFADSYVLTASSQDRRSYIRRYNQLPNVKQVVAADLDLRDLYRNLVETKMDDAQAELYRSDDVVVDVMELQALLQEVDDTYRQWFALISESDVKDAEKEALGNGVDV